MVRTVTGTLSLDLAREEMYLMPLGESLAREREVCLMPFLDNVTKAS